MDTHKKTGYNKNMKPPFGVEGEIEIARYALWACNLDLAMAYILTLIVKTSESSGVGYSLLSNQQISDSLDRAVSWGKIHRAISALCESGMIIREKKHKKPSSYRPDYDTIQEMVVNSEAYKHYGK